MEQLVDGPDLGRPREEVRAGYRSAHEGRHLIFYRAMEDRVEIVRILHERMDWRRQLAEETEP